MTFKELREESGMNLKELMVDIIGTITFVLLMGLVGLELIVLFG